MVTHILFYNFNIAILALKLFAGKQQQPAQHGSSCNEFG